MRYRFISICSIVCVFQAFLFTPAKAQLTDPPRGIWFHDTHTSARRFAYSQTILWPSSVGGHLYLYLKGEKESISWRTYRKSFTLPPVWESDAISWNYGAHPIMGSFYYLSFRNKNAHWAEAFAGATINSAIYEYIIAGGTQRPSANDMIITPVLGSILGEGIYQVKKHCLKDRHLNLFEKIMITASDPFEVLYYGFNYNKICRVNYR